MHVFGAVGEMLEPKVAQGKHRNLGLLGLNALTFLCEAQVLTTLSVCTSFVTQYLCYFFSRLPKGFKDLLVVLQIDVCEHVGRHFVSLAQVSLQALIVDFTLKLGYDRTWLNQTDTVANKDIQQTTIIIILICFA